MKIKSLIAIILALVLGLLGGYLIFGSSDTATSGPYRHDYSKAEASPLWTCAMHPQIQREEPGDCPVCGMDLIPAESNALGLLANQFKMTENALALANIQTTVVGNASNTALGTFTLSGKIAVNENGTATQPAHFDGRIEALYVNSVGQKVNRGQLVARIYSPELVAAQQELITASKMKIKQPRLYEAVRNKFKNWMISGNVLDQIETSGKVVSQFPVYAHVTGVVTEITVNEGGHIMDGMPIFKVSNLSNVWAEFDVYESQLGLVKNGQKLDITTNAYPDTVLKGSISFIDPILNTGTRTAVVRVTLPNKDNVLKPGMFVSAQVEAAAETAGEVTIPASAVMWTGKRSLVYVKPDPAEPVFEMREVTLGQKQGDYYTILQGLSPGEELVVSGTFSVDAAAQLQGKKSMMREPDKAGSNKPIQMKRSLPEGFEKKLKVSIPAYLKLKDAFVASDASAVNASAKVFREQLLQASAGDLEEMEKSHYSKILQMLNALIDNTQLENQREHFVILNENLVALINAASTLDQKLFLQRCPMANENKGAVWLSDSEQIKNPYYGDAMPGCGSVIEIFGK